MLNIFAWSGSGT